MAALQRDQVEEEMAALRLEHTRSPHPLWWAKWSGWIVGAIIGLDCGFVTGYAIMIASGSLPWAIIVGLSGAILNYILYSTDTQDMVHTLFTGKMFKDLEQSCQLYNDTTGSYDKLNLKLYRMKSTLIFLASIITIAAGIAMFGLTMHSIAGFLGLAPVSFLPIFGAIIMAIGTAALNWMVLSNFIINPSAAFRFMTEELFIGPKATFVYQNPSHLGHIKDLGHGAFLFTPDGPIPAETKIELEFLIVNEQVPPKSIHYQPLQTPIKVEFTIEQNDLAASQNNSIVIHMHRNKYQSLINEQRAKMKWDHSLSTWINRGFRVVFTLAFLFIAIIATVAMIGIWHHDLQTALTKSFGLAKSFSQAFSTIVVWGLTLIGETAFAMRCAFKVAIMFSKWLVSLPASLKKIPGHIKKWHDEHKNEHWLDYSISLLTSSVWTFLKLIVLSMVVINAVGNGKVVTEVNTAVKSAFSWLGNGIVSVISSDRFVNLAEASISAATMHLYTVDLVDEQRGTLDDQMKYLKAE